MIYKLIIPGRLPGLNEHIKASNTNFHVGNKLKKETENLISWFIRQQIKVKIEKPVTLHFLWIETNRKRDLDNISFAKKYIQDSLVSCGILKNDGWGWVRGLSDEFEVDSENPRIEVTIKEI